MAEEATTSGPRARARGATRGPALEIAALWGLAVAQPVLDLFGASPTFFVANRLSTAEIVAFAVAVALVGPLVLGALVVGAASVDDRAGRAVHLGLVALLGAALVANAARSLGVDDAVSVVLVAGLGGFGLAWLRTAYEAVASGLRLLAVTPVVVLLWFVLISPAADLLTDRGGSGGADAIARAAPVVVLSLDELPLASLLRADGSLNEERFPNLAALANTSTWYRNATSVSWRTELSVPATFTGRLPEVSDVPTAADHPRSLYTLLGDTHEQRVVEQVTALCPAATCPRDGGIDERRLGTALVDAAVAYGHLTLPPELREDLPSVDATWGRFLDGDDAGADEAPELVAEEASLNFVDPGGVARPRGPDPSCPRTLLWCGAPALSELVARVGPADGPVLYAAHVTYPHSPWTRSPAGHQYASPSTTPGVDPVSGTWSPDPRFAREGLQRHLWAAGHADALIGELRTALEREGQWDDAVVVVVADHGVAFSPGLPARDPVAGNRAELYGIPLFVKAPGQRDGDVRAGGASNVDVLPTIVDLLGVRTDWAFDGASLAGAGPLPQERPVVGDDGLTALAVDDADLVEVARRNATVLPHGDDWRAVAAVGPLGDLVGTPVAELAPRADRSRTALVDERAALASWAPDTEVFAPLLLHGALYGVEPGDDVLVALDDRVAGVAVLGEPLPDGGLAFTSLLADGLLAEGAQRVSFLVPEGPGATDFARFGLSP